jgi:nucleotide-binding universal stress UspA family protein
MDDRTLIPTDGSAVARAAADAAIAVANRSEAHVYASHVPDPGEATRESEGERERGLVTGGERALAAVAERAADARNFSENKRSRGGSS